LRLAHTRFKKKIPKDYFDFTLKNADWLDSYALFMSVKDEMGGGDFHTFPHEYLHRTDIEGMEDRFAEGISFYKFVQYEFFTQWKKLRKYANSKGIKIIGDIPIYVSADSADVWGNPEEFLLDENLCPTAVAGVPPDAFSEDGQLWGNPLYNWERMKKNVYKWWCRRIGHAKELYDKIRIDHFVGFSNYFSIPKDAKTPAEGEIVKGPRYSLFECIREAHPDADIIAEDLGMMQDGVEALLRMTGFPGMKVIQFSFEGDDNPHALDKHTENTVVYTGTHDNPTTNGFFAALSKSKRLKYSKILPKTHKNIVDRTIAYAMSSVSDTVIIPIQDYMRLGDEARINAPSTTGSNWSWMLPEDYAALPLKRRIAAFAKENRRARK
jgi:4-alpha-glucanotransferase